MSGEWRVESDLIDALSMGKRDIHEGPRRTTKAKRYPRRATKNGEGPLRGWRRLERALPKVGKGERIFRKGAVEPLGEATAMGRFRVDPSGGDGRGCARLGAGGTPALPASLHSLTPSHQGHNIAEAFGRRLSLKEVYLSSCLFVFIRVHSWFVFMNNRPVSPQMIRTAGRGPG